MNYLNFKTLLYALHDLYKKRKRERELTIENASETQGCFLQWCYITENHGIAQHSPYESEENRHREVWRDSSPVWSVFSAGYLSVC